MSDPAFPCWQPDIVTINGEGAKTMSDQRIEQFDDFERPRFTQSVDCGPAIPRPPSQGATAVSRFRKKPVVVEARQLTIFNLEEIEKWCGGSIKGTKLPREDRCIDIWTLKGEMRAEMGDWIIKGIKGEFYPCKPDIFTATYEPAEQPL